MAVDELRLRQSWNGEVLLVRAAREGEEERAFNLAMLARLVWSDWRVLRDIAIGSIAITVLSVLPILLVMRTISTVIQYKSSNTLALVTVVLVLCVAFDLLLRFGRKLLEVVLAAKLDAKLNLLIFERLVSLPIEFFERQQAGQTAYQIGQVHHVREFLTGKLMNTFIDVFMVALLLPLLFYLNATLAWTILIAAGLIAVIIALFLRPLGIMTGKVIAAEAAKGSVLVETIYGIRTVKALALEPARSADWDRKVANTAEAFMAAGRLANWPESLSLPLQRYCQYGVLMLGAYLAIHVQQSGRYRLAHRLHAARRPGGRAAGQPRHGDGGCAAGARRHRPSGRGAEPAEREARADPGAAAALRRRHRIHRRHLPL